MNAKKGVVTGFSAEIAMVISGIVAIASWVFGGLINLLVMGAVLAF